MKNYRADFLKVINSIPVGNPAIILVSTFSSTPKYLSYGGLISIVKKLTASVFGTLTISKDFCQCIGLSSMQRHHLLPIILSAWESGFGVAPISSQEEIEFNRKYLCCDYHISNLQLRLVFAIDNVEYFIYENVQDMDDDMLRPLKTTISDICFSLTTSGTTGTPKIVRVPWACIFPNAIDVADSVEITSKDVIFSIVPPTFDPFFVDVFCSLSTGAAILFVNASVPYTDAFLPNQLVWHSCEEKGNSDWFSHVPDIVTFDCRWEYTNRPLLATVLQITPSLLFKMFDLKKLLGPKSSCKKLILGGERFPVLAVPPDCSCKVFNVYGITEVSCWALIHEVTDFTKPNISLGKPLRDIMLKIEDGELLIGSSRKCLIGSELPDHLPRVVYRKTGDIIEHDEASGDIIFISRVDNVIKKHGNKVDILKIIDILKDCDFLKDFAVVMSEDDQLVAWFLVFKSSSSSKKPLNLTVEKRNTMGEKVFPKLSSIEKPDCMFEVDAIPLSNHGKKDLRALRSILKEVHDKSDLDRLKIFKELWCNLLGIAEATPNATFLDYGGNSALALSLISRLSFSGHQVPNSLLPYLLDKRTFVECATLFEESSTKEMLFDTVSTCGSSLKMVWEFNMAKCVDASPETIAINGKWCVVVGSHSCRLSAVTCIDAEEIWTTELGGRIEAGVCSTKDGRLLVVGCYDGAVYCVAAETGVVAWKLQTGAMVKCTGRLGNDGNSIYVGSYDKKLYRITSQTGEAIKSVKLSEGSILGRPSLSRNDLLYVCTLDGCYACLNAESFEVIWSGKLKTPIFAEPCLLSSEETVVFTEVEGILHCFNASSGKKVWQYQCGGNVFGGMTVLEYEGVQHATFGSHDNHIYLLRIESFPYLRWKRQVGSPIYGKPSYENGLIACAETLGVVHIYSVLGDVICSYNLNGEIFSSPKLFNQRIFLGCRNNALVCLSL